MACLKVGRRLKPRLQRNELVPELRQPAGEGRSLCLERSYELIPPVFANGVGIPGIERALPRKPEAVDRSYDSADLDGVEVGVPLAQIDPSVGANLRTVQADEHGSIGGAEDRRSRDARVERGLLVVGVLAYLRLRQRLEQLLDREDAVRRRESPDLTELAARHGSDERGAVAERVTIGDLRGVSGIEHRLSIGAAFQTFRAAGSPCSRR
jgi:hypothetical protein